MVCQTSKAHYRPGNLDIEAALVHRIIRLCVSPKYQPVYFQILHNFKQSVTDAK